MSDKCKQMAEKIVHDWIEDYPEPLRKDVTPAMRQHLVETITENLTAVSAK
jgi:hypothetical protein